jgi:hypothetical protein
MANQGESETFRQVDCVEGDVEYDCSQVWQDQACVAYKSAPQERIKRGEKVEAEIEPTQKKEQFLAEAGPEIANFLAKTPVSDKGRDAIAAAFDKATSYGRVGPPVNYHVWRYAEMRIVLSAQFSLLSRGAALAR